MDILNRMWPKNQTNLKVKHECVLIKIDIDVGNDVRRCWIISLVRPGVAYLLEDRSFSW